MPEQEEQWRPVVGFPDYVVSDRGRVASLKRRDPHVLSSSIGASGYRKVNLFASDDGSRHTKNVHALVAEAFHGPRLEGMQVRHLDGDRLHNHAANLAWGTASENMYDAVRHGRNHEANKTSCHAGHPYVDENTTFGRGRRRCRPCDRARAAARRDARRAAATEVAA